MRIFADLPAHLHARSGPLADANRLAGDTRPIHDPSLIRQGKTYYLFTTDVIGLPPGNYLPIRCSEDKVNWRDCGNIFPAIPDWVKAAVPGVVGFWAPDVSYFNGLYHVYYSASTLTSQQSVIGVATNTTLDPTDPAYKWVDHGPVLSSKYGDDFNAIDPNIFLDGDGAVWMTYGSYWSGIKQVQIDPKTGMAIQPSVRYNLAARPDVSLHPIEGASLVRHGDYYYLFVSVDLCCNYDVATDSYKEAVGRSTSPHGPFFDIDGNRMTEGAATVIVKGNGAWIGPGGGTAYIDPATGESLMVFHALKASENGAMYLWIKHIAWVNDWPTLTD